MGARIVFHCDLNKFYASVEQAEHPELRGLPIIVAGKEELRHGIVLTASVEAKAAGVRTAQTLREARLVCPEALVLPPHYELYHHYSRLARRIYYDYTDLVEPFGPDEAWLDVTDSLHLFGGDARLLATEISERVQAELGVSISVGISWNKVFAKFGSDADPGNGIVEITPGNAAELVWARPARELLYIGPRTAVKLARLGILTVGQVALADPADLTRLLGKVGLVLQSFALGRDESPVRPMLETTTDVWREVKGVGNGITAPFDIVDPETARQVVWIMGESVAQRLRALGLAGRCVSVWARDARDLSGASHQTTLARPTCLTSEVCDCAFRLLAEAWPLDPSWPLRGLGVRVSQLSDATLPVQLDVEGVEQRRLRLRALDEATDALRARFGNHAVRRLSELTHPELAELDPERDHVTHPVSFFA